MIELSTRRLRLRPFTRADLPALLEIHRHPGLARFVPSAVCADLDDAAAALARFAGYDDGLLGIPAIELRDDPRATLDAGPDDPPPTPDTDSDSDTDTGPVVGLVMLKHLPPSGTPGAALASSPRRRPPAILPGPGEDWDVEIGWRAHPAYEGRGYIAEAARAALAHAFAHGLDRIVAVTDPDNGPSQRVAERIGMRRLGTTRRYYDELSTLFEADRATYPQGPAPTTG